MASAYYWIFDFHCSSGGCVPAYGRCDSYVDCADNSDELNCHCAQEGKYKCQSGTLCLHPFLKCDGFPQCPDRDDEQRCICTDSQFKCKSSGECIPDIWICDTWKDCQDGSDENPAVCSNDCYQFKCEVSGECLPLSVLCDGVNDCADMSDEAFDVCGDCNPGQVVCPGESKQCLPLEWMCDTITDCENGMDEDPGLCGKHSCSSSQFRCDDGTCIDLKGKCDGWADCPRNGEDESDCSKENTKTSCPDSEFACLHSKNQCVSSWFVCDGYRDCKNGEDELFCDKDASEDGRVNCANTVQVLPESYVCDNIVDCLDHSDENPEYCRLKCDPDEFKCATHPKCILRLWQCDDSADCLDGSDEQNCEDYNQYGDSGGYGSCSDQQFQCVEDGVCIPYWWLCDGWENCVDGSDEMDCYQCPGWNDVQNCNTTFFKNLTDFVNNPPANMAQQFIESGICNNIQEAIDCSFGVSETMALSDDFDICRKFLDAVSFETSQFISAAAIGCSITVPANISDDNCQTQQTIEDQVNSIQSCKEQFQWEFANSSLMCSNVADLMACIGNESLTCSEYVRDNYYYAYAFVMFSIEELYKCNSTNVKGVIEEMLGTSLPTPTSKEEYCTDAISKCQVMLLSAMKNESYTSETLGVHLLEGMSVANFFVPHHQSDLYKLSEMRDSICLTYNAVDISEIQACFAKIEPVCNNTAQKVPSTTEMSDHLKGLGTLCDTNCNNLNGMVSAWDECYNADLGLEDYVEMVIEKAVTGNDYSQHCSDIQRVFDCVINSTGVCGYLTKNFVQSLFPIADTVGPFCKLKINYPIKYQGQCDRATLMSNNLVHCQDAVLFDPSHPTDVCSNLQSIINCQMRDFGQCLFLDDFYSAMTAMEIYGSAVIFNCQISIGGVTLQNSDILQRGSCDNTWSVLNCVKQMLIDAFAERNLPIHMKEFSKVTMSQNGLLAALLSTTEILYNIEDSRERMDKFNEMLTLGTYIFSFGTKEDICRAFSSAENSGVQMENVLTCVHNIQSNISNCAEVLHGQYSIRSSKRPVSYRSNWLVSQMLTRPLSDTLHGTRTDALHMSIPQNSDGGNSRVIDPRMAMSVFAATCDSDCSSMQNKFERMNLCFTTVNLEFATKTLFRNVLQGMSEVNVGCNQAQRVIDCAMTATGNCLFLIDMAFPKAVCVAEQVGVLCHMNLDYEVKKQGCENMRSRSKNIFDCLQQVINTNNASSMCNTIQTGAECVWTESENCPLISDVIGSHTNQIVALSNVMLDCNISKSGEEITYDKNGKCDPWVEELKCEHELYQNLLKQYPPFKHFELGIALVQSIGVTNNMKLIYMVGMEYGISAELVTSVVQLPGATQNLPSYCRATSPISIANNLACKVNIPDKCDYSVNNSAGICTDDKNAEAVSIYSDENIQRGISLALKRSSPPISSQLKARIQIPAAQAQYESTYSPHMTSDPASIAGMFSEAMQIHGLICRPDCRDFFSNFLTIEACGNIAEQSSRRVSIIMFTESTNDVLRECTKLIENYDCMMDGIGQCNELLSFIPMLESLQRIVQTCRGYVGIRNVSASGAGRIALLFEEEWQLMLTFIIIQILKRGIVFVLA